MHPEAPRVSRNPAFDRSSVNGVARQEPVWIRRALIGNAAAASPSMAAFGDGAVLGILALQTAGLAVAATLGWKWAFHRARERGLLDKVTNY